MKTLKKFLPYLNYPFITFSLLSLLLSLLLALTGCAKIVMPYAENPLCSKGTAGGYCGSITDVNAVTDKEMEERKKKKTNNNSQKKEVR